jgi:hypothetical protein
MNLSERGNSHFLGKKTLGLHETEPFFGVTAEIMQIEMK